MCAFGDFAGCGQPAAYLIAYSEEVLGAEALACVDHAAQVRAHDPLGYVEGIRSLPRTSQVSS